MKSATSGRNDDGWFLSPLRPTMTEQDVRRVWQLDTNRLAKGRQVQGEPMREGVDLCRRLGIDPFKAPRTGQNPKLPPPPRRQGDGPHG